MRFILGGRALIARTGFLKRAAGSAVILVLVLFGAAPATIGASYTCSLYLPGF
jgi:hypothetical protein